MAIAGGLLVLIVVGALLGLLVQAAFLLWGARIARIEQRTYAKALGTALLGGIAAFILALVLGVIPIVGHVLGIIGGFFISALIMMPIFNTTFAKALGATVLAWTLFLVISGLLMLVAGGIGFLTWIQKFH